MNFELVAATAYLTCGALMLFLGFVVLRENPRQRVNRAVSGMLVFGGLGPILGGYSNLAGSSAETGGFQDLFSQFAFLWEFFFPSALLFALVFPTLHPLIRRWPRVAALLFVPHIFHVVLVMLMGDTTNLLDRLDPGESAPVLGQAIGVLGVALELLLRVHVRFFSFVNLSMAVASWIILMRSARRTRNPKLRSQVRMIRLGLGISLALYSGGELLPTAFGLTIDRAVSLPLVTVSLLVGAVSIVVAIVRLGFLDIRFIVRRGLVYGLASGVIVALYLFVGKQIDQFSAQVVGQYVPVFETTFLVLSLFLLQPVLAGIERVVDRSYSRDGGDLRNALTRLSEKVALILEPDEIAEVVAETIRREMVLDSAAVVTRNRATGVFRLASVREEATTDPNWHAGAPLFDVLEGRRDPVPRQDLVEQHRDPAVRETLEGALGALRVRTAIPLYAAEREGRGGKPELVGAILLGWKITETRMTFEEETLVLLIAQQVGIGIQNAALHEEQMANRLLEEEVATARKIQQQLLPPEPPAIPGWEVCASNSPSRHVGGDYHDFLPFPRGDMGIAIGDVSGKGVPAALLMSNLQAALRVRAHGGQPTEEVVEEVNRQICQNTGLESFISFFLGELEPNGGQLSFTNAGHNAPVVVRKSGAIETLDVGGLLLGVFPEASYERGCVGLEPGDFVAFYTDGVTEAMNPQGELYSEERFVETLLRYRSHTAGEIHDGVLAEIAKFQQGSAPDDDLTLILLKRALDGSAPETNGGGR